MKYRINDTGVELEGSTPAEIVEQLKAGGIFTQDTNVETYLIEASARFQFYFGETVCFESPECFISDLVRIGYLAAF